MIDDRGGRRVLHSLPLRLRGRAASGEQRHQEECGECSERGRATAMRHAFPRISHGVLHEWAQRLLAKHAAFR
ncbi:hypothetical protein FM106_20325 [Brachybacterium faecium]|nr:hypothetical protein FM106_20325 [Brachybacterium faecium]